AVRLRRTRRDAEDETDLLVRQSLRDELDDLTLAGRDRRWISECQHGSRLRSGASAWYRPKGVSLEARVRAAADERRLVPAGVRVCELVLGQRTDPKQELELVAQVRSHHLRAVRGDRERDAVVHEPANRLPHRVLARERLRQQVRRGADLERDL